MRLDVVGAVMPNGMTHQRFLAGAVARSTGPILEFGAGFYSTPLLQGMAMALDRPLVTVEIKPEWAAWVREFATGSHLVVNGDYAAERTSVHETFSHWGVIFLDHTNGDRYDELGWAKDHADYVVLHDAEGPLDAACYAGFRAVKEDRSEQPRTVIGSMVDDLEWIP